MGAIVAALLAWPLITSGPAQFFGSTLSYQLIQRGGGVQFSIWTFIPPVALVARPVLATALVLLAISPVRRPGVTDPRQHAALAAALLVGAQLLLGYRFYTYLIWFYPLLLIAVIQPPRRRDAGTGPGNEVQLPLVAAPSIDEVRPAGVRLVHSSTERHETEWGPGPWPHMT